MNKLPTLKIPTLAIALPAPVAAFAARTRTLYVHMATSSAPRLSVKEQMFFIKRLSFLVKASIPILESLHMINEQADSKRHRRILVQVIDDVSNGQSLAKSLGRFPNIFGDFAINVIKVGEAGGMLSSNLDYLAEELKKKNALANKIVGAFVYPAIIGVATVGITIFLMVYLFPKITPVFAQLGARLPLSTRIVMGASNFLRFNGIFLAFAIAIVVGAIIVALKKSERLRFWFDTAILKIPLFGSMARDYILANIMRTLGLLLKSGITLSTAMPLAADMTGNLAYKRELKKLAAAVDRGDKISTHLMKRPALFPDVVAQMVAVGERSGTLSTTLVYLAEMYEGEVDDFTKNLSSIVEPVLMVVMGVVVGFIAISIITPIYGLTSNLHA